VGLDHNYTTDDDSTIAGATARWSIFRS